MSGAKMVTHDTSVMVNSGVHAQRQDPDVAHLHSARGEENGQVEREDASRCRELLARDFVHDGRVDEMRQHVAHKREAAAVDYDLTRNGQKDMESGSYT
ncbi:TPA: hypothetical protein N0F65_005589 [Lagenidium giganteum]|uniref:Uncharacterized protein n=1 Tax=Lagenidium giganteum TaxID=4803 RepID=A0AAV2Z6K1_9STRA|nr:TPA: hypothetical protein N0F65_005589 [Lagenidium giganteum]